MKTTDHELIVEIDGGNVAPDNVDAPKMLSMAAAYLTLLQSVAHRFDVDLTATGLQIRDKCVAIVTRTSDIVTAKLATQEIAAYLNGHMDPPHGCRDEAKRLGDALRSLPNQQTARILGGSGWEISLNAPPSADDLPANELWSIRAIPYRVGGAKRSIVNFQSELDDIQFSLRTSRKMAQEIAPYIYKPLDIEAEIARAHAGHISGILLNFAPVQDVSPEEALAAWKQWFQENASDLDAVPFEELEVALGRTQD
jgi:hypothetical protein